MGWGGLSAIVTIVFVYPACCNVMRTAALALVSCCRVNIEDYGKETLFKAFHMF